MHDLENDAFKNKEVADSDDDISLNETPLTLFNNISTTGTPTIYKGKKGTVINYFIPDNDPINLIRMENQQVSSKSNVSKTVEQEMDEDKDKNADTLGDHSDSSNESNDFSDSEDERPSLPPSFKFPLSTVNESYAYLKFVWSEFNPPVQEKDVQDCSFGLIFFSDEKRNKGWPFVGKVLRRFSSDEDSRIQYLEMECLKYTLGAPTVLEKNPSHFDREIDIIPAWDVVAGPLKVKTSAASIRK